MIGIVMNYIDLTMIGIVMNYNDLTVHRYTFATGIRSVLHVQARNHAGGFEWFGRTPFQD